MEERRLARLLSKTLSRSNKKHPIHISHCIKFSAFVYGEVGGDNNSSPTFTAVYLHRQSSTSSQIQDKVYQIPLCIDDFIEIVDRI